MVERKVEGLRLKEPSAEAKVDWGLSVLVG